MATSKSTDGIKKPATKKAATAKAVTAESTAKKTANKTANKTVSKTKTSSKKSSGTSIVTSANRLQMIEVAAYYIAEKNGFSGQSADHWLAAEKQIDSQLNA